MSNAAATSPATSTSPCSWARGRSSAFSSSLRPIRRRRSSVVLGSCLAGQDHYDTAAQLRGTATKVLVEHATLLAPPDRAFISDAVNHYLELTLRAGGEVDGELVSAASRAAAEP